MELIGAESCDEIRWFTGAFCLVLVNWTLIRYVSKFGVMTVVELYNLLMLLYLHGG